jgi:hypothetical protein
MSTEIKRTTDVWKVLEEWILDNKVEEVYYCRFRDLASIGHRFTDVTLRELKVGGGGFLLPVEEDRFRRMLGRHGKAFAFSPKEIRCVDLTVVEPMVIFTVPHVPWNLKPIPVPRAHIPKLMELLKQKMEMGILELSSAPYSN